METKAIVSDDKSMIVLADSDKEECMTTEEYNDAYGPVPAEPVPEVDRLYASQLIRFYASFGALVKAYGKLDWAKEAKHNYEEGVYPACGILEQKLGENVIGKLDGAIKSRRLAICSLTRKLSLLSRELKLPFSESDKKLLQENLHSTSFRERTLYRTKKYLSKGKLLSVRAIIEEVQKSFKG